MQYNTAKISGIVSSELEKSYSFRKEDFYSFTIDCKRQSGKIDTIDIIASNLQFVGETLNEGDFVNIVGQFRSQLITVEEEGRKYSKLFIFVSNINKEEVEEGVDDINEVDIAGEIVRVGQCRETPSGREIVDFTMKVERDYSRFDYIPCVAWGRKARAVSKLPVQSKLRCIGRIQAREQTRKNGDKIDRFNTFEISCSEIEIPEA